MTGFANWERRSPPVPSPSSCCLQQSGRCREPARSRRRWRRRGHRWQELRSVALETRCKGVKEGFANTENLQVNGADLPSVQSTIAAKLQQDKTIEGVGARLGLEFFPWSNVKTLHDGLRLVEATGSDAVGVVIDVWHIERARTPVADLASVPLHRIIGVELNDADPDVVGTLFEDTVHRRRYCGEGSFDLPGIVAALRTAGWTGPWGVEILSEEHRSLPVRDALERAADGARRLLAVESGDG